MFNPRPADLSDRDPLFHVASTTEFWYRSWEFLTLQCFPATVSRICRTRSSD
jgi:hypothetical protein